MIRKEYYRTREDGVRLYRTYSDDGFIIKQVDTGIFYEEAIDVESASHVYEETYELIENPDDENAYKAEK